MISSPARGSRGPATADVDYFMPGEAVEGFSARRCVTLDALTRQLLSIRRVLDSSVMPDSAMVVLRSPSSEIFHDADEAGVSRARLCYQLALSHRRHDDSMGGSDMQLFESMRLSPLLRGPGASVSFMSCALVAGALCAPR